MVWGQAMVIGNVDRDQRTKAVEMGKRRMTATMGA